jgi:DNA-binding NtrC family response regulator
MQVKLLRFLQEDTFVPVGGRVPKRADTRVVAATHRDQEAMVREGNQSEASRRLGISRVGLIKKLTRLGLR